MMSFLTPKKRPFRKFLETVCIPFERLFSILIQIDLFLLVLELSFFFGNVILNIFCHFTFSSATGKDVGSGCCRLHVRDATPSNTSLPALPVTTFEKHFLLISFEVDKSSFNLGRKKHRLERALEAKDWTNHLQFKTAVAL